MASIYGWRSPIYYPPVGFQEGGDETEAGANTHASYEIFQLRGHTHHWELSVASGMVRNIKFQGAKADGKLTLPNNWQIHFSELERKPKTYNAFFSCIKGARILWLEDSAYPSGYSGW